jgi:murein DD-endopeptidase MepM/ murein hydrolase activator NlpD
MRTRRTRVLALTMMVATAMIAVAPAPAQADHRKRQAELERLIRSRRAAIKQAEAKERDIVARIEESDVRRDALERRLDAISSRLRASQDELDLATARLDVATQELALASKELEQTLGKLEEKRAILDARAASLYMMEPGPIVTAFRTAQSFRDVLDAGMFAESIVRRDADVAAQVAQAARDAEAQRARIERSRDALAQNRATIAREHAKIVQARAEQAAATRAVRSEIAVKERLLGDVRSEIARHEAAIASYKRESASIAAFLRNQQAGQTAIKGRGGWLKWPISGRQSSGYGNRTHPISGKQSFHAGIDIAAPTGTTIGAARAGEVVYAGWRGAYGLIVVIDHGESVATLYAHASRTFVRVGEVVSTGQSIAAVGSTGYSTGPHLHFEVRVNGEPTNPHAWL